MKPYFQTSAHLLLRPFLLVLSVSLCLCGSARALDPELTTPYKVQVVLRDSPVTFNYFTPLSPPAIDGMDARLLGPISVSDEVVLRFGMLERAKQVDVPGATLVTLPLFVSSTTATPGRHAGLGHPNATGQAWLIMIAEDPVGPRVWREGPFVFTDGCRNLPGDLDDHCHREGTAGYAFGRSVTLDELEYKAA